METDTPWIVRKSSPQTIVRFESHVLLPQAVIMDMFWSLIGPSLLAVLKERRHGIAKQLKAQAIVPTSLCNLAIGLLDKHIESMIECQSFFLGRYHRYDEEIGGGYTLVIPPSQDTTQPNQSDNNNFLLL